MMRRMINVDIVRLLRVFSVWCGSSPESCVGNPGAQAMTATDHGENGMAPND